MQVKVIQMPDFCNLKCMKFMCYRCIIVVLQAIQQIEEKFYSFPLLVIKQYMVPNHRKYSSLLSVIS